MPKKHKARGNQQKHNKRQSFPKNYISDDGKPLLLAPALLSQFVDERKLREMLRFYRLAATDWLLAPR